MTPHTPDKKGALDSLARHEANNAPLYQRLLRMTPAARAEQLLNRAKKNLPLMEEVEGEAADTEPQQKRRSTRQHHG